MSRTGPGLTPQDSALTPGGRRRPERAAPRFRWFPYPHEVIYLAGALSGRGVLYDLSMAGARIDRVSQRMAPGSQIYLAFAEPQSCRTAQIAAEVVRETDTGFAVVFAGLGRRARRLLTLAISRAIASD